MFDSLADMKVIELGNGVTVSYAGKLLADLGADVIKVEAPGVGDTLRSEGSFPDDGQDATVGALFNYLNAGKRSIELNIGGKDDVEKLLRIVSGADLIIENLGAGALEGLGIDMKRLERANPRIAIVRISNFGQDGPYSDLPVSELTLQAASMWVTRHQSAHPIPVSVGGRLCDYVPAVFAACAAMTAYKSAADLREQVVVDLSKSECLLNVLPQPALFNETTQALGMGTAEDRVFPVPGITPCKDGMVGINVLTAQQHADMCNMIGVPEYIEKQLEINKISPTLYQFYKDIEPWMMEHTAEKIVELSQAFRVPSAPVGNGANLPQMSQMKARDFYRKSPDGDYVEPGYPYRHGRSYASGPERRPAPKLGEHNTEVAESPWRRPGEPRSPGTAKAEAQEYLPFKGLRVMDIGTFWAGPAVGCYLGAMGADVIKLESVQRPDGFRYVGAYLPMGDKWYEMGGPFQGTNLNKRGLTLDLTSDEGKGLYERLLKSADVVIENFSPRVLENFGYSAPSSLELNPKLIVLRMPGFGLEGPWREYASWAMSIEQACGWAWTCGFPELLPMNTGGFADPVVGMHALVAVQAALLQREKSGKGDIIEVAQFETGACLTAEQVIAYQLTGKLLSRIGNRSTTMAPQGVYQCADNSWIALTVRNDAEWRKLLQIIGASDTNKFPTFAERQAHHVEIDELISAWTKVRQPDEVVAAIRTEDIMVEKNMTASMLYDDPHLQARKYYQELQSAVQGMRRYPRFPMQQSPGPKGFHRFGSPSLGQHNYEILRNELGLADEDIKGLESKSIIGTVPKGM